MREDERKADLAREQSLNQLPSKPPADDIKELEARFAALDTVVGAQAVNQGSSSRSNASTVGSSQAGGTTSFTSNLHQYMPLPRYNLEAQGVASSNPLSAAAAIDAQMHREMAQTVLRQIGPAINLLHQTRDRSHAELVSSRGFEERAQAARERGEPIEQIQCLEEEAMLRLQSASSLAHAADTLYQRVTSLLTQADHEQALAAQVSSLFEGHAATRSRTDGELMEMEWTSGADEELYKEEGDGEENEVDDGDVQKDPKGKAKAE
ncbi:hypothetical protein PENSPDRAFT_694782 [Peniophora sp. CONT]|nr:hypothetical protein PENSPDRAFT_694782 [Peniophora sp. CONT]